MSAGWLRREGDDWVLALRVQPRATRDEVAGIVADRLKVRICAPPTDGRANDHLQRWLAGLLGVTRSQVQIEQGTTSRDKRVRLTGIRESPESILSAAAAPPHKPASRHVGQTAPQTRR
ncbi:MAG: DUF167 family protein [Steroidobacteraceae bacterium]